MYRLVDYTVICKASYLAVYRPYSTVPSGTPEVTGIFFSDVVFFLVLGLLLFEFCLIEMLCYDVVPVFQFVYYSLVWCFVQIHEYKTSLYIFVIIIWIRYNIICDSKDISALKPCWSLNNILLDSRCSIMLLASMCCGNLHVMQVSEIS